MSSIRVDAACAISDPTMLRFGKSQRVNLDIDPQTAVLLILTFMAVVGVIVTLLIQLQDRRERRAPRPRQ